MAASLAVGPFCRPDPPAVELQEFRFKRQQYLDNLPPNRSLILITPNSRDFLLAVPLAFAFFLTQPLSSKTCMTRIGIQGSAAHVCDNMHTQASRTLTGITTSVKYIHVHSNSFDTEPVYVSSKSSTPHRQHGCTAKRHPGGLSSAALL